MSQIDKFLTLAIEHNASDIHFSSGECIFFRVDGDLVPINDQPVSADSLTKLINEILTPLEKEKYTKSKNLDKRYECPGGENFRLNVFQTHRGIAAVCRTIPRKVPTLAELELPDICEGVTTLHKGLVLVTGPTGSGKSTTLASMIDHINENYPYHILTAEDPIEFVHKSKKSMVNQREIGNSCHSFADALKYALREDPDVILVGELRDLETISLALTAAETGHLVFGTLHTRGAAPSIDRIIDSFPSTHQPMIRTMLSDSLAAVISQALLKRKEGKGRVAAFEVMVVNHAIANLIREGKIFQIPSIMQTAKRDGMCLMESSIQELVSAGIITQQEGAPVLNTIEEKPKNRLSEKTPPSKIMPVKPAAVPPSILNLKNLSSPGTPPPPTKEIVPINDILTEDSQGADISYVLSMGIEEDVDPKEKSKESSITKAQVPPPIPKFKRS